MTVATHNCSPRTSNRRFPAAGNANGSGGNGGGGQQVVCLLGYLTSADAGFKTSSTLGDFMNRRNSSVNWSSSFLNCSLLFSLFDPSSSFSRDVPLNTRMRRGIIDHNSGNKSEVNRASRCSGAKFG